MNSEINSNLIDPAILNYFFPNIQDIQIETLKENFVFKLKVIENNNINTYVLRKTYPTWNQDRRKKEYDIAQSASLCGIGPKIFQHTSDYSCSLIEYVEHGILDPNDPVNIDQLAHSLLQLHKSEVSSLEPATSTSFNRFYQQIKTIKDKIPEFGTNSNLKDYNKESENHQKFKDRLIEFEKNVMYIEKEFLEFKLPLVLCHLDLHYHNIMKNYILIDYGMSGLDYSLLDLSNAMMYLHLTPDQEDQFLHLMGLSSIEKKLYPLGRAISYINKFTWKLLQVFSEGDSENSIDMINKLFENVQNSIINPPNIQPYFDNIYNQNKYTNKDLIDCAFVAYCNFYHWKNKY